MRSDCVQVLRWSCCRCVECVFPIILSVAVNLTSTRWRSSSLTAQSCKRMCWETSSLVTRVLVSLEVTGAQVLKRRGSIELAMLWCWLRVFPGRSRHSCWQFLRPCALMCWRFSPTHTHRSHLRLSIWLHHLNTGSKLVRQLNDTRVNLGRVFSTSLFLWAITDTHLRTEDGVYVCVCAFRRNHQILTCHRRF